MAGWPLPRWEAALGRWIPSGGWQASESEHSKSHPPRLAGGKAAGPRQCDLGGHRILWTEAGVTEYLYRALRPRVRGLRLPGPVQHDQAQGPCPVQDTQAGLQERPGLCTGPHPRLQASDVTSGRRPTGPPWPGLPHLSLHLFPSSPVSPFAIIIIFIYNSFIKI